MYHLAIFNQAAVLPAKDGHDPGICVCCKAVVFFQGPLGVPGVRRAHCQCCASLVLNIRDTCAEEKCGLMPPVHPSPEMRAAQHGLALGIMGQRKHKTFIVSTGCLKTQSVLGWGTRAVTGPVQGGVLSGSTDNSSVAQLGAVFPCMFEGRLRREDLLFLHSLVGFYALGAAYGLAQHI